MPDPFTAALIALMAGGAGAGTGIGLSTGAAVGGLSAGGLATGIGVGGGGAALAGGGALTATQLAPAGAAPQLGPAIGTGLSGPIGPGVGLDPGLVSSQLGKPGVAQAGGKNFFTDIFGGVGKILKLGNVGFQEKRSKAALQNAQNPNAPQVPVPQKPGAGRLALGEFGSGLAAQLGGLALGGAGAAGANALGASPGFSNAIGRSVQGASIGAVDTFRQSVLNEANTRDLTTDALRGGEKLLAGTKSTKGSDSASAGLIEFFNSAAQSGANSITRQSQAGIQGASAARRGANINIEPGAPQGTPAALQALALRAAEAAAKKNKKKSGGGGFSVDKLGLGGFF